MMLLAAQGVLDGKDSARFIARPGDKGLQPGSRGHDCRRPCDGQSACIPAFLTPQLPGNDVSGAEAKSTGYGSLV